MFQKHCKTNSNHPLFVLMFSLMMIVLVFLFVAPVSAFVVKKPTFAALTQQSDRIVLAKVSFIKKTISPSKKKTISPSKLPFIETTFEVSKVFKGNLNKTLKIRIIGGNSGIYKLNIPGIPRFKVGQEVFLFVRRFPKSQWPLLVALYHGVFDLKKSKQGYLVTSRGSVLPTQPLQQFERKLRLTIAQTSPFVRPPSLKNKETNNK